MKENGKLLLEKEEITLFLNSIDNECIELHLSGVINVNTADDLMLSFDELDLKYKPKYYIFDFHNVEYVSSAGIGVFMDLFERINDHSGKICFVQMHKNIKEVFDLMCFSQYFIFVDSLDDAKESMRQSP
ncbi:MAG: STAS domain-containing protein [Spirochaetales bacterium]|nr:STAS domain-containing protein [Spirochaetales bacterium]